MNDRSSKAIARPVEVRLPPNVSADGARRHILEGTLRMFATRGFHGTSMRDLAAAIGLPASAVYLHFASKEHLLAELVRVGHEAHHDEIRIAMLEAGSHPVAQVCALVRAHTRMHTRYPELAIVVNTELETLSPELAAPGLALRKQSVALLVAVLERGTAMGHFAPPDIRVVAAALGAIGLRIPHWYSAESSGLSPEDLAEIHVQLALRMLGTSPTKDSAR
jgi:AcrR family transcriptional regulator